MIEVKGLSERVVKADIGEIFIKIENQNPNLKELYTKRTEDKKKTLDFLKKFGIADKDIVSINSDTEERTIHYEKKKEERYFTGSDIIYIKTKNIEQIDKLKSEIVNLCTENILISCSYCYKFTDFQSIKLDMIDEASRNARESAVSSIKPYNKNITDVSYITQGEVSIRAENEFEDVSSWESREKTSINKRIRLIVRAGFLHD